MKYNSLLPCLSCAANNGECQYKVDGRPYPARGHYNIACGGCLYYVPKCEISEVKGERYITNSA
jgi:hypothetical protein